jgi:hypothetical protein
MGCVANAALPVPGERKARKGTSLENVYAVPASLTRAPAIAPPGAASKATLVADALTRRSGMAAGPSDALQMGEPSMRIRSWLQMPANCSYCRSTRATEGSAAPVPLARGMMSRRMIARPSETTANHPEYVGTITDTRYSWLDTL